MVCMYVCVCVSHLMGAFTPNSPSVRQQMINGYQLRDRGRRDSVDRSNMVVSPPRRLIMFTGAHYGLIATLCSTVMIMILVNSAHNVCLLAHESDYY